MSYVATVVNLQDWQDAICALWLNNLPIQSTDQAHIKLDQGYAHNPAGQGAGVILQSDESPALIGVIGLHPRQLLMGERCLAVANTADFVVDERHRTIGPALQLMKAAIAEGHARFDFIYGIANPNSGAICKRAGMKKLGTLSRFATVLRSKRHAAKRTHPALATLIAPLIDTWLWAANTRRHLGNPRRLKLCAATFSDPRIAQAWQDRPRELMLSNRDAHMLSWRFARTGHSAWSICLSHNRDGRCVGWVVWRLHNGVAEVGDVFSTAPLTMTTALLAAFNRFARAQGADSVSLEFLGNAQVRRAIQRAGYFSLPDGGQPVFISDRHARAPNSLSNWYFTGFDNDAD